MCAKEKVRLNSVGEHVTESGKSAFGREEGRRGCERTRFVREMRRFSEGLKCAGNKHDDRPSSLPFTMRHPRSDNGLRSSHGERVCHARVCTRVRGTHRPRGVNRRRKPTRAAFRPGVRPNLSVGQQCIRASAQP